MKRITIVLSDSPKTIHQNKFINPKFLLSLILCLTGLSFNSFAAPTFIDLTFGTDGKVVSSPGNAELTSNTGIALQTDGKIVMVGGDENLGFIVARYNANGSLDTAFGNNGWTATTFGTTSALATSVEIQPDGKIVVGGRIFNFVNNIFTDDFAVARYNSDGSLDSTFDGDGKATISFNPEVISSASEYLISLKIAPDGKIIIAGRLVFFPQIGKFGIARLNADGSLDTTFGTNGRLVSNTNLYDYLNDLTVLPDGSMIAVGSSSGGAVSSRKAEKYNVNGVLQWVFSQFDGEFLRADLLGVAAQPDGKIILTGVRAGKVVVIRLNPDGTVDNSFNVPAGLPSGEAISAAIQPDGKIVVNISVFGNSSFSLVRFNTNGSLDTGFGVGGYINITVTTGTEVGKKVFLQPDGRILVGGYLRLSSPTRYYFSMIRFQGDFVAPDKTAFDYDGDGKSDVSVFRPSTGIWYLNQSTNGFSAAQFGISTDRIVPADYDGDDKTDLAVYRDGVWWILQSGNSSVAAFQFGLPEDKPQSGDFDGDGKDDLAVFRPSTGVWYVLRSSDGGFSATQFGLSTDIPQSADYDGDGRTDLAVFRPSNGTWYIQRSLGGYLFPQFGANGDQPIANDFDGDGRTDIAVRRPSTRQWFILRSSDSQFEIKTFGMQDDIPVPADYDGDGKADIAVFRPSNGGWYQSLTTSGNASQIFGLNNDLPTPGAFNP